MGKFDGVLLASDFDDTLYSTDGTVSAENYAAIEYFTRAGGIFTVATGRAHPTFAPYANIAPINAPVVLSNGSALYDFKADRMIYETYLPDRVKGDMIQVARDIPEIGFEAYHGDDIYAYQPNPITQRHIARVGIGYTEIPIADMPQPWSKVILQQLSPSLLKTQAYMLERWSEHYEVIFSNSVLLELTCKGSNKGGMVRYLADLLGIDHRHIYCVGDNQNDIPMLDISAIAFAPSNCAPEVAAHGARMLGSCDESCIAQLIGILDTIY